MACGIYGIHKVINDKWYVGQAVNIRARWNSHRSLLSRNEKESIHLLRAWNKYGPNAFEWIILEECTPDQLDEREIFWIAQKDSYRNGYNRTTGGGGIRGFHLSKGHAEKLRKSTKELWANPDHREKRLIAMRAATSSDEYREKLSHAGKRNWADPEFKEKSLKRMQEGSHKPESMKKRKASLRIAFQNPESKAKLSEASKRNWQSDEYRKKMEVARKSFMNEEYRERAREQSEKRWRLSSYRSLVKANISRAKRELAPEVLQVETGMVYRSIADAAESLNISYAHILSVCHGKRRMAGGFHWRYASESQEEWDAKRAVFLKSAGIVEFPKVVCIETGEVFDQPKTAAESIGVHPSNITKVCRGEQLSAGGKHWRYYDEAPEFREKREALIALNENRIANEHSRVRIRCVETNTVFNSVSEAANSLQINRSGISNALRGKAKTAGSYHWEYVDAERPAKYGCRRIICIESGEVFQSLSEAAAKFGLSHSSISNALRGKTGMAGNRHWAYYSEDSFPEDEDIVKPTKA